MPPNNIPLALPRFLAAAEIPPLVRDEAGNNNNNHNPIWNAREYLFQTIFLRMAVGYARTCNHTMRKFFEGILLFIAWLSLLILMYIHVAFIQSRMYCLDHISKEWPRDGILRVEVLANGQKESCTVENSFKEQSNLETLNVSVSFSKLKNYTKDGLANTVSSNNESISSDENEQNTHLKPEDIENFNASLHHNEQIKDAVKQMTCSVALKVPSSDFEMLSKTVWPQQEYIVEYSLEYGFLKLSPSIRHKLNIPVQIVTLDPQHNDCFGNWLSRFLLSHFVGYEDVLMISLKNLVDKDENKGYVRNVVTGEQYRFVNKCMSCTSCLAAAFIMMVFTLSVSMLLRYSHHQIFLFIIQLLHMLDFNLNFTFPAAPLLTVVLALVGMEAIMSEFFNDSSTSFYIILIIWLADQYDTVCCRTIISKRHWLRFFYLYHFAFYAYNYRFNGQYSGLALFTSWLFIQHSMVYFFHKYELPSILRDVADNLPIQNFTNANPIARSNTRQQDVQNVENSEQNSNLWSSENSTESTSTISDQPAQSDATT